MKDNYPFFSVLFVARMRLIVCHYPGMWLLMSTKVACSFKEVTERITTPLCNSSVESSRDFKIGINWLQKQWEHKWDYIFRLETVTCRLRSPNMDTVHLVVWYLSEWGGWQFNMFESKLVHIRHINYVLNNVNKMETKCQQIREVGGHIRASSSTINISTFSTQGNRQEIIKMHESRHCSRNEIIKSKYCTK